VTDDQRDLLIRRAGQRPVSTYIKELLGFHATESDPIGERIDGAHIRLDAVEGDVNALSRRLDRLEALAEGSDY
jgi:hypothetical protein